MIKSEAETDMSRAIRQAVHPRPGVGSSVSSQITQLEREVIFLERAVEDAKSKGRSTAHLSVMADSKRCIIRDLLADRDLVSHKPKAG